MDPQPHDLITTGGIGGIILALIYALRLMLDWRRSRTHDAAGDTPPPPTGMEDAATANAILSQTIRELRDENKRLTQRVATLEEENAHKERTLDDLEDKVRSLTTQLAQVTEELAALRTR